MRILGYRIFKSKEIDKISKLILGTPEDREIARMLILQNEPKETLDYPKIRVAIRGDKLMGQFKTNKDSNWSELCSEYFYSVQDKERKTKIITQQLLQKKEQLTRIEETYYINL